MIPLQVSQVRNIWLAKSTKVKYSNLRLVYTKLFAIWKYMHIQENTTTGYYIDAYHMLGESTCNLNIDKVKSMDCCKASLRKKWKSI